MTHILYYILIVVNVFTFILYGYDKFLAKSQKRRIPEKNLLISALLGGSMGAGISMLLFRHKTSKWTFLWKYFVVLAIHIGLWYGLKSII